MELENFFSVEAPQAAGLLSVALVLYFRSTGDVHYPSVLALDRSGKQPSLVLLSLRIC